MQGSQSMRIDLIAINTGEAVDRLNELLDEDDNVAAALHLTC